MTREEEEEVRSLLSRHQARIMLDLSGTELLAILVKNSVLTQSEEDLLLKSYRPEAPTPTPSSAPSSAALTKRKLSAVISSGSGSGSTNSGGGGCNSSIAGSSAANSRCASVNGDHTISDNRSITPSVVVGVGGSENVVGGIGAKDSDLNTNLNSINDADILRAQCTKLIEIIAKSGFEKFKQFCYAIESECPQLIEDLINDRLKCETTIVNTSANEEKIQKELETIDYIEKEKENDRNRRAVSYGGTTPNANNTSTLPRAAPRRVSLMKDPPPPPPPKPTLSQQSSVQSSSSTTASPILSKYPQSEYNLIQKIDSVSTLTAPAQYQAHNFYANTPTIPSQSTGNNYSSLFCHTNSASSPLAVRKREKLLHRFSDAATLGRKLKKKKNTNRACRSMTEAIEMLADPVIEDEFFIFNQDQEKSLVQYILKCAGHYYGLSITELRQLAYQLSKKIDVCPEGWEDEMMAPRHWYYKFMKRHPQLVLRTPEQTSMNRAKAFCKSNVDLFFQNFNSVLTSEHDIMATNIFNMDESGFSTVPSKIGKVIALKGMRRVGKMEAAERGTMVTMALTVSAAGNSLPPFFLFPRKKLQSSFLDSVSSGTVGYANGSGWMCQPEFVHYMRHFIAFAKPSLASPVILLMDNHCSHLSVEAIDLAIENGVHIVTFPPHCSHRLQPLDVSVFGPVKAYYKSQCSAWQKNNANKGDRTTWEYHTVSVTRVPGYGFGIAVSGGRDNPHFANGDPSIAVSDVLKGGPAEDRLQVNDRIISVNGVSLENVEYATAVQVLRDSGNTVTLVVKRRVPLNMTTQHQHSHSMSSVGLAAVSASNSNGLPMQPGIVGMTSMSQPNSLNSSMVNNTPVTTPGQPIKLTLSKGSKKDDFGIVLGCRLFVKEISTKARDQLAANGYTLQEGDIITRIHNTNCGDTMSLKEAKKIIDGCKERLNLVVLRDITNQAAATAAANQLNNSTTQSHLYASHQAQISNCSNNLDDPYLGGVGPGGYSSQNLYVQPPTRSSANGPSNGLNDEKSNLTPRGRSRGPLLDGGVSLSQLDRPVTPPNGTSSRTRSDEPPRPPPPRGSGGANEDFYSSRRQLYEDDSLQRSRQSAEPRFISFQKEGSVGIRLTGGNEAGIFVTAVQPGSPASLQGLTPGDKILKVNDMDMHGVTREEAVLFLLSLQDRIDLIVQYCKEEYDEVVTNQRGDSFHIKTHFHCDNPSKGEMAFKAGDVFRVIDTLHNGVVGSWQVLKIGRGHQEMQRGVIPNKSRAEELATAQFNATKKEMNANESRGNFFRRRRSTHRRSKSLSRENWDDVVFSDSISKFPAYERVVLRHPGFVRPVVLFGPVSDVAREKLTKDFPDKFTAPLQDDDKSNSKCRIVRLSNIRDIMDRGKHALLDITPNAVDRLNYAQFYPVVIFLKTDNKHVIKHLRQGVPKSAHKSSKKLLDQCQKLERVWSHIFSTQIVLNDEESWYRKLREAIDLQQSGAVWMSESKPVESLSDDFLFPMTTSRLSYASSPESDLELSPGPSTSLSLGNLPQLVKSSSDPSIATNQDNLDRDRDIIGEGLPPPYTNPYDHSINPPASRRQTMDTSKYGGFIPGGNTSADAVTAAVAIATTRPQSLYGIHAPDLPPRIDRQSKPEPGELPTPVTLRTSSSGGAGGTIGRSAQERLFGKPIVSADVQAEYITRNNATDSMDRQQASLERQARMNAAAGKHAGIVAGTTIQQNGSYDSVSSYDSYNTAQLTMQNLGRLGPNAPDDLKSVPNANSGRPLPAIGLNSNTPEYARSTHDHHARNFVGANDLNRQSSPGRPQYHDVNAARNIDPRNGNPQRPSNLGLDGSPRKQIVETKTDYGKYSRNNSASQADYSKLPKNPHMAVQPPNINGGSGGSGTPNSNSSGGPFKPVPPPKPKNYRPPMQGGAAQWENGEPGSPRSPNGFYYPPSSTHHHYSQQTPGSPHQGPHSGSMQPSYNNNGSSSGAGSGAVNVNPYAQQPPHYAPANGYNGTSHHYNGGSGTGPYIAPHRGMPPQIGNLPPHTPERHALDLAGSREQRGSAFELYRKPQIGSAGHHHNMSEMELYNNERYDSYYSMPPPPPPLGDHYRSRSAPRYPHERPPHPQDPNYYNYQIQHQQQQLQRPPPSQQQYYDEHGILQPPTPVPPLKVKKKSMLKSPLAAIKNALIKTTRPLRRMNSMVEPERKPKSSIKRQRSMLERGMQRPYYPDEYPTYPAGFEGRSYDGDSRFGGVPSPAHAMLTREQYYQQQYMRPYVGMPQPRDIMNSTYQNLEGEDIYGNIGTAARAQRAGHYNEGYNGYEHDDLYANRALIDLERRQAEAAAAAAGRNGRRILRRHSTTTADRVAVERRRPMVPHAAGAGEAYEPDDIYQSRQGAYMLDAQQRRAPNSEVMTRRRFYPGAANELVGEQPEPVYQSRREMQREMQRNHLYQSRKEMQERIAQGKKDIQREFSPHSSSQSERDDKSERDAIYQTRREVKESGLKTRTQLREQIYQTRREALETMAEPLYVSKRDNGRPEPIYESREESILHHRENETDEKKEEKTEVVAIAEINQDEETLSRSDLQKSTDTVIENIMTVSKSPITAKAPLVQCEDDDDDADDDLHDINESYSLQAEQITAIENTKHNQAMLVGDDDNENMSDDVFEAASATNSSTLIVEGPPIEPLAPPKPTKPLTPPRKARSPFHISNILKRTGPPPISTIGDSHTSIETQYTSQASLPVGPPNATSTPYTSNMSLPIAGPVPIAAPSAASLPVKGGPFPSMPREPATTRGTFDSTGGTLSDSVWNVSLQIPAGAIPQGVRQEIYFTVSDPRMGEAVGGPPLDMENGETMLSPLVMCGPQGLEFLVPVTLNIPHCAGRTASLGLALKATDSEKNLHTEWDNIDLPSNAAAHTVSVKVDHF